MSICATKSQQIMARSNKIYMLEAELQKAPTKYRSSVVLIYNNTLAPGMYVDIIYWDLMAQTVIRIHPPISYHKY